jgi:hypothetical protein
MNDPSMAGCAPALNGHLGDVLELFAHHLGAANGTADSCLVQHGPVLGRVAGGEALLAGGADRDLAFDGLFVSGGGCGVHERPVVPGGLEQAGHEFGIVFVDGRGFGFEAEVNLEPFGYGEDRLPSRRTRHRAGRTGFHRTGTSYTGRERCC